MLIILLGLRLYKKGESGLIAESTIKNILIVARKRLSQERTKARLGGGDSNLVRITDVWQNKYKVAINYFPHNDENGNSVLKSLVMSIFSQIKREKNLENVDIIISSSGFLDDVILTARISRKIKKAAVCYFYHLNPPLLFHPVKRGILRVIIVSIMHKLSLLIAKINNISLFLIHHENYSLRGIKTYEADIIIDQLMAREISNDHLEKSYDLCYSGRFQKSKGIDDLIDICVTLKNRGYNPRIAIIGGWGSPKYLSHAKKKIQRKNMEDAFTFFGYVSEEEKYDILKKSKAFINLSYEEGWSISISEAVASKIPVIAYDLPAYSYIKGAFYQSEPGDLEKVVSNYIDIINDPNQAEEKTEKAYRLLKEYVEDNNAEKIALKHIRIFGKM